MQSIKSSALILGRVLKEKKDTERITEMHKECSFFKRTVSSYEQEAKSFSAATSRAFACLLPLLASSLPRVWVNSAGSKRLAEPLPMATTHNGMGPTIGSPEFDSLPCINDALERFLYQSHETIRDPLLKWVEAFDAASSLIPEMGRLGKEVERQAERVRKAELSYRKRFYAASGGGGAVSSTTVGNCTSFFSCKSRSKSMDNLRISRPDLSLADPNTEGGGMSVVHRGVPIALELKEDEASIRLKQEINRLEAVTDAYDAMENSLNESLAGLCEDSAWLKSYMISQLMLLKDLTQETLTFLGPSLPLSAALGPSADSASTSASTIRQEPTRKDDLIAAMPSFLSDITLRAAMVDGPKCIKNLSTPLAKATSLKARPLNRTSNITPRSSEALEDD